MSVAIRLPSPILIFRTGQLGDTLVSLPAIHAIRERHAASVIVLLTDRHPGRAFVSSWDVLAGTGWIDEVEFYTPESSTPRQWHNLWRLIRRLRNRSLEHVYLLTSGRNQWQRWRDSFFFRFVVGARFCHDTNASAALVKYSDGSLARTEPEWRRLLDAIPAVDSPEFHLPISAAARQEAEDALAAAGAANGRVLVAVAPGSKMPAKMWPTERYCELGQRLLAEFDNVDLVVLGGAEDTLVADELCALWGRRSHNLAGNISVIGAAAVLERCAIYVGNDTGTMHLAAMAGVHCVALFSARDNPGKWEPFGSGHTVLRREVDCAGCMLEICSEHNNKCLRLIGVDEVFCAVQDTLRTKERVN